MSSYTNPTEFLALIADEMKAQNLDEDKVREAFKEDFPQVYFIIFETDTFDGDGDVECGAQVAAGVLLGYYTGIVRRGSI